MDEIYDYLHELGFSTNEAKVYVALVAKNPISGYEVAKCSNITRTMVYDILKRLIRRGVIEIIENDPVLYKPIPYKALFKNYKEEYNNRLEMLENALDNIEIEQHNENYIKNISDFNNMVQEVKSLIQSAKNEIYISIWEEEANLFLEDIRDADERGVRIFTFSFGNIPYDYGTKYTYNIETQELNKIWHRRRIIIVADRERILIGEGNDKIEEISIITSNTMLVELAIDQMLLDIIHLYELKKGGYLPEQIRNIEQYTDAVKLFHKELNINVEEVPKRVDQD